MPPINHTDTDTLNKLSLFGSEYGEDEVKINKNMFIIDERTPGFTKHLSSMKQNALLNYSYEISLDNSNIITEHKKRFTCVDKLTKSDKGDSGGPLFFFNDDRPIFIGGLLGISPDICDGKTDDTNAKFGYGPVIINSSYYLNWINQYFDNLYIFDYATKNISIYENPLQRGLF